MDSLTQHLIDNAIPTTEGIKSSSLSTNTLNLQNQIIEVFRFANLNQIPPFLSAFSQSISAYAKSKDKRQRYASAVCLMALISLFPFDEYTPQYMSIAKLLIAPGYKPILQVGCAVLNRFARISGPRRDFYIQELIECSRVDLETNQNVDAQYAAALIWEQLSPIATDQFFQLGTKFNKTVIYVIRHHEKQIQDLTISMIKSLFTSEFCSNGNLFLLTLREDLINECTSIIADAKESNNILSTFQLLHVLISLPPTLSKKQVETVLAPQCLRLFNSQNFATMHCAVSTICELCKVEAIQRTDSLFEGVMNMLCDFAIIRPQETQPILEEVILSFPSHTERNAQYLLQSFSNFLRQLPKDTGPPFVLSLTITTIQALPSDTSISMFLSNVSKIMQVSVIPLQIHKIIKALNRSHAGWATSFRFFHTQMLGLIKEELIQNSSRTDRICMALRSLRNLPSISYPDAIDTNELVLRQRSSKDFEVRELITSSVLSLFDDFPNKLPMETVQKLVTFALEDPVRSVRRKTLKALTPATYKYLAQSELFNIFAKFAQDESTDVRKAAMNIIKELPLTNLTLMRTWVVSSLKQMNSNFNIIVPESDPVWIVFPHVLQCAHPIIDVYCDGIYGILMGMLHTRFDKPVTTARALVYMNSAIHQDIDESLIKSITKLHMMRPNDVPLQPVLQIFASALLRPIHPWVKIHILKSLKNLGSAEVIIDKCPELIPSLFSIIQDNTSVKMVVKALKVIGSIGIIDITPPIEHETIVFHSSLANLIGIKKDFLQKYFKYLTQLFNQESIDSGREAVSKVISILFRLEPDTIPEQLDHFLSIYLSFIKTATTTRLPVFFKYLTQIIDEAGHLILPYTDQIFQTLEDHWHKDFTSEVSEIFSSLIFATRGQCDSIIHLLTSVAFILLKSKPNAEQCAPSIFAMLNAIAYFSPSYLPSIVSNVLQILQAPDNPSYLMAHALDTVEFMVKYCEVGEQLAAIKRCMLLIESRSLARWRERSRQILQAKRSTLEKMQPNEPSTMPVEAIPLAEFLEHFKPPSKKSSNLPPSELYIKWFNEFSVYLVSISPLSVIRTCLELPSLPKSAFKYAFISVWLKYSDTELPEISDVLLHILKISKVPEYITKQFINLVVFATLCEIDLGVNLRVVAERCIDLRLYSKALFLFEAFLLDNPAPTPDIITSLIRLNKMVNRSDESHSLAATHRDTLSYKTFMELGEWQIALSKQPDNFADTVKCLAAVDDWSEVLMHECEFSAQTSTVQSSHAKYFMIAESIRGQMNNALAFMQKTSGYTVDDCIQRAILHVKLGHLDDAIDAIHLGYRYLAATIGVVERHNKFLISGHLFQAAELFELQEVIRIKHNPALAPTLTRWWLHRLSFLNDDPYKQKELYKIRALVSDLVDPTDFAFHIIHNAKGNKEMCKHLLDLFFPELESQEHRYAVIQTLLEKKDRIPQALFLLKTATGHVEQRLKNFLGKSILKSATSADEVKDALTYLQSANKNFSQIADAATMMAHITGKDEFALKAVEALAHQFAKNDMHSRLLTQQLLALSLNFPESALVADAVISVFKSIAPKHLVHISLIALLLLMNESTHVQRLAMVTCNIIQAAVPQSIAFDLLLAVEGHKDVKAYQDLSVLLQQNSPVVFSQFSLIAGKLTKVFKTVYEKTLSILDQALKALQRNEDATSIVQQIPPILNETGLCKYEADFVRVHRDAFANFLKGPLTVDTVTKMINRIIRKQDSIRIIPLTSVDTQLARKTNWQLSMFTQNEEVPISHFGNSLQRLDTGFCITIFGTNGKKYNFHLKEEEGIRRRQSELFLSMMNSITSTSLTQRTVIRLSLHVCLIEMLKGHVQIYDLIWMYNKSRGREVDAELAIQQKRYDSFDHAKRVRKINTLANRPDRLDLARAILTTSSSAMDYLRRSSNFATSLGMLSAISFVLGSVDTSPSGILIDKKTGRVTLTNFVATGNEQPVPFRLTTMITAAFGSAGVHGPFCIALKKSVHQMRKHKNALATCLQFSIDAPPFLSHLPKQYIGGQGEIDDIDKFYQRIKGDASIEDEIENLLKKASSVNKMAKMPASWIPWW